MSQTAIPGVAYAYDEVRRAFTAAGRPDLLFPTVTGWQTPYNADEPWRLLPGESYTDNMPAGVPIVDAIASDDWFDVLTAAEAALPGPGYIRLAARHYKIRQFRSYGATDWRGWTNGNRKVMGWHSLHGPERTSIDLAPGAIAASPGAVDYVLNPTSLTSPIQVTGLYLSNTQTSVPIFISGVSFRGTIQTPLSVYSANAQTKFRRNHTVPSPLAWRGMQIWRAIPGSRIQHTRFQGWGYSLNTAPPYEMGCVDSNYDDGLVIDRIEVDGRIAAEFDPARPRASGGWMWNKSLDVTMQDSYEHHTRRSGWATNTNTGLMSETYRGIRFRADTIADELDGFAGDMGGFNGSNVEEVVGRFYYENCHLTPMAAQAHINWATPYRLGTGGNLVLPTGRPVIEVRGFHTASPEYGGCLRIAVSQRPNSTGESPAWTRLQQVGINASGFFDIRNQRGLPMTGVKASGTSPHDPVYNAALHKPDTHYVVKF